MEQWLAQLGVGGAIAGMLFYFYRQDTARYAARWQGQSEALLSVVKENTMAITQNTEVVRSLHRRMDRLDGILVPGEPPPSGQERRDP